MENESSKNTQSSFNVIGNVLLVSIQSELYDDSVADLREEILNQVYKERRTGVLIDVSNVEIIDSFILRMLVDIAKMTKLLGTELLFIGMKPEIVASLVDFGHISKEFRVAPSIDDGIHSLNSSKA